MITEKDRRISPPVFEFFKVAQSGSQSAQNFQQGLVASAAVATVTITATAATAVTTTAAATTTVATTTTAATGLIATATAATTVAAATTATAGLVAATTTTAAAFAIGALFTGTGLVHGQGASVHIFAVKGFDGGIRFADIRHGDESKTFRAAGEFVHNDAGLINGTKGSELGCQRGLGRFISEVSNVYFHLLCFSGRRF